MNARLLSLFCLAGCLGGLSPTAFAREGDSFHGRPMADSVKSIIVNGKNVAGEDLANKDLAQRAAGGSAATGKDSAGMDDWADGDFLVYNNYYCRGAHGFLLTGQQAIDCCEYQSGTLRGVGKKTVTGSCPGLTDEIVLDVVYRAAGFEKMNDTNTKNLNALGGKQNGFDPDNPSTAQGSTLAPPGGGPAPPGNPPAPPAPSSGGATAGGESEKSTDKVKGSSTALASKIPLIGDKLAKLMGGGGGSGSGTMGGGLGASDGGTAATAPATAASPAPEGGAQYAAGGGGGGGGGGSGRPDGSVDQVEWNIPGQGAAQGEAGKEGSSEDPADYFDRIGRGESLFKRVEERYKQKRPGFAPKL